MNTITKVIAGACAGLIIGMTLPAKAEEETDRLLRHTHMYQSGYADAVSTCLNKGQSECLEYLQITGEFDVEPQSDEWRGLMEYRYGYAHGVRDALEVSD